MAVLWNDKYARDCHATKVAHNDEKKAFTLSEVLITLVIIGVVAAITAPIVQANIRKKATLTQLKKGYSTLSQLIKRSELDNGPLQTWEFPVKNVSELTDKDFLMKYFVPYINSVNQYDKYSSRIINSIDGNNTQVAPYWVKLPDGGSISIFSNLAIDKNNGKVGGYCWLFYDINNSNEPNRLGKDIFMFNIFTRGKILKFWGNDRNFNTLQEDNTYTCKKGTNVKYAGAYCGELIERNNWKFPDGYPI